MVFVLYCEVLRTAVDPRVRVTPPQDTILKDAAMPRASPRRKVSKTIRAWGSTRAA
jgi:hypothetical protein